MEVKNFPRSQSRNMNKKKNQSGGLTPSQRSEVQKLISNTFLQETEQKYWPLEMNNSTSYGGSLYGLSDVPQGDTDYQRDGDSLNKESLDLNYQIVRGDITQAFRLILFEWIPQTTPSQAEVWSTLGSGLAPLGYPVFDHKQVMRVLIDRLYGLSDTNTQIVDSIHLKLNGKIQFDNGTTAGSHKLFLFIISDSAATSHPAFNGVSIFKFRDS